MTLDRRQGLRKQQKQDKGTAGRRWPQPPQDALPLPTQATEKMRQRELRWPQSPQDTPPPHPRHLRTGRATFGILSPSESTMTQNKGKWRETGCWVCVLGYRVKVRVIQSCLTLCDPLDYTVHGILQARILKWVAFPFSWDLPKPGTEPRSPTLQVDSSPAEPQGKPRG